MSLWCFHVFPSSLLIALTSGVRAHVIGFAFGTLNRFEWSFHSATRCPVFGIRFTDIGLHGERKLEGPGADHACPPSLLLTSSGTAD